MAEEVIARALDGTGRVEADLSSGKERVFITTDWEVAEKITKTVPKNGVPVTILTGFLGAGKTTVLNYILNQNHGLRIAILVNEFGEVDIDSQIIQKGTMESDDTILLKNGCICCTISNSFVESVQRALSASERAPPDYLVIETSGVADPEPIITNLQETELDEIIYLDQVLTVVDAANFHVAEMASAAAHSQIQCADVVLLSKTDLVDNQQAGEVLKELLALKPGIRIIPSRQGEVPIASLFDIAVPRKTSSSGKDGPVPAAPKPQTPKTNDHKAALSKHLQTDLFESLSFVASRPFDLKLFRSRFLKDLPSLSGRRFRIEQDDWPVDADRSNQLVVIGRHMDRDLLRGILESCLISPSDTPSNDYAILAK